MKKYFCIVLPLVAALLLYSCGVPTEDQALPDMYIYNGASADWVTYDEKYIYSNIQSPTQIVDIQTGKSCDFIRDPFFNIDENFNPVKYAFSDISNIYYLYDIDNGIEIIKRSNKTMEEKTIYKKIFYSQPKEIFLGAFKTSGANAGDIIGKDIVNRFAVFENVLFVFFNDSILTVDLYTHKEKTFKTALLNGNYSYYNGILYFIDTNYNIYAYDIQSGELQKIPNYKAQLLMIMPTGIYFSDANDFGRMHKINFSFEDETVITQNAVCAMDYSGEYIYYLSDNSSDIYKIKSDGTEYLRVCSLQNVFDIICLKHAENTILLIYSDDTGKSTIKKVTI